VGFGFWRGSRASAQGSVPSGLSPRLGPERRALAAFGLGAFATLYLLLGLLIPPPASRLILAFGLLYLFAFLGVAAEWFFGRWVAMGVAFSGAMSGLIGLLQIGLHPVLLVYAGFHGLVFACLYGQAMSHRFEGQEAWRKRFGMDDEGVERLGKAVTRGAASAPYLLSLLLAPRDQGTSFAWTLGATVLAVAALGGLLRNRAWGALALGLAVPAALAACWAWPQSASPVGPVAAASAALGGTFATPTLSLLIPAAPLFLALAFAPLAQPLFRFLAHPPTLPRSPRA
jgi:hypothetical protein